MKQLDDRHSAEIESLNYESSATVEVLKAELASLEKLRHIPNVIEKSRKLEAQISARQSQAQEHADETILLAHREAERITARIAAKLNEAEQRASDILQAADRDAASLRHKIITEMDSDAKKAKEALRVAEWQAGNLIEEAQKKAKQIASQARPCRQISGDLSRIGKVSYDDSPQECPRCAATRSRKRTGNASRISSPAGQATPA
jgi:cell division septum initiation protein DivIVA